MSQCKEGKSLFTDLTPFRVLEKRSKKGGEDSSVCDVLMSVMILLPLTSLMSFFFGQTDITNKNLTNLRFVSVFLLLSNKTWNKSSICQSFVRSTSDVRRLYYKFVTFFHYLIFFICKIHCYKNIKIYFFLSFSYKLEICIKMIVTLE